MRSVRQYSYRFEVRATPEQHALLCRIAGSCRFVYNKASALQRIRVVGGPPISCRLTQAVLNDWHTAGVFPDDPEANGFHTRGRIDACNRLACGNGTESLRTHSMERYCA